MTVCYCTYCWREQPAMAALCAHCRTPIASPENNGVPYTEKLLLALQVAEPETRASAALVLGRVGERGDQRVALALRAALDATLDSTARGTSADGLTVQAAAAQVLAQLDDCEASEALSDLALYRDIPLVSGLSAVQALSELAASGCAHAAWRLEVIAREAAQAAIRMERDR